MKELNNFAVYVIRKGSILFPFWVFRYNFFYKVAVIYLCFSYYFSAHKSLTGFSEGFSDDRNITVQKQKPQLYG